MTVRDLFSPKDRLLNTLSRGPAVPTPFETVNAAFLSHVRARPTAEAIIDLTKEGERSVTYEELAHLAGFVANKLKENGVGPGARVPILARRGLEMIAGILGILFVGAQYIPLDGGVVSDSTLAHVLSQSRSKTIVTLHSLEYRLENLRPENVLFVDQLLAEATMYESNYDFVSAEYAASAESGCYVIYTSGTTGTPKGVDVTHQNVTNLLCLAPGNIGMGPGLKVGSVLSISFDMGAWEILGSLCNGCSLVLRGSDWDQVLRRINVLVATPTILSKFDPAKYEKIRSVGTAGEPLPQRVADNWTNAGKTLYCGCGPTEVTIVNTLTTHVPGRPVSIGKPTPNNNVYILDDNMEPVPFGEIGVMWAGGKGISNGYVGLPELNFKRFTVDKFAKDGTKMFNTGDLVRWRADGCLEILGRQDDQVKIKGFRVELDGVATSLSSCAGVSAAAVIVQGGKLYGFVTPKTCDIKQVDPCMREKQPYYAIPESIITLDAFPVTPNGKIDKKALALLLASPITISDPEKATTEPPTNVFEPCTAMYERRLAAVEKEAAFLRAALEKERSAICSMSNTSTTSMESGSLDPVDLNAPVPEKKHGKKARGLRNRIFIVYRRLFSVVWIANLVILALILAIPSINRIWFSHLAAINLTIAVLARQDYVINLLYTIFCSVPTSWPLWIRTRCGLIYHFGGVHSGAASSATLWFIITLYYNMKMKFSSDPSLVIRTSTVTLVMSWIGVVLLMVVAGVAWPSFRKDHHDLFEQVHRFAGWTALGVLWLQTIFAINDARFPAQSLGNAVARSPNFWLILLSTLSIMVSWFHLRKVTVNSEILSNHVVRLHFDYTVPVNGSFTRLSERPLLEWHSFATVPAPEPENGQRKGYSLVVSNAGDWTKRQIQTRPTKIWVRGVPTCGVMRVATLFNRIVIVGTGSGIGPLLGFIKAPTCPFRLVWSTKNPEKTFGVPLCDEIMRQDPNAVIHDTVKSGRPNLVKMSFHTAKSFGAEAVIIIANEKITRKVVYGLETRGIAAYGAIWDS